MSVSPPDLSSIAKEPVEEEDDDDVADVYAGSPLAQRAISRSALDQEAAEQSLLEDNQLETDGDVDG